KKKESITGIFVPGARHGSAYGPTQNVQGLVVSSTNEIFASDVRYRIHVFNMKGVFLRNFSTGNMEPRAISIGRNDTLFGSPGSGAGNLYNPCGICVDSLGRVIVADTGNSRVEMFTTEGDHIRTVAYIHRPALVATAQKHLDDAYAKAEAEVIQEKIDRIAHLHVTKQHDAAWKTINELTGRKSKPTVKLKGGSPEERKDNWLAHFKSLLGSSTRTPSAKQLKMSPVAEDLDIVTDAFTPNVNEDKGIEIQPRRSRRHPAQYLTDLDFADDLALIAELIKNAETLLQSLEEAASLNRYCFMVQKVGHLPVSFKNDWTGLIQNSCGGHRIYLGGNMPLSKKFMEDSQDCLKNSPTVELCSLDIVSEPSKKLFHLYSCGNHVDECTPEV
ncbi:hypothetical protein Bbelb_441920, partial [Branchiostoma belcheri]